MKSFLNSIRFGKRMKRRKRILREEPTEFRAPDESNGDNLESRRTGKANVPKAEGSDKPNMKYKKARSEERCSRKYVRKPIFQ